MVLGRSSGAAKAELSMILQIIMTPIGTDNVDDNYCIRIYHNQVNLSVFGLSDALNNAASNSIHGVSHW